MSSQGSELFSNEGVEAFNKCLKLPQGFLRDAERGKDDHVASNAVLHGDEDAMPASRNFDGGSIHVEGRSVVAKPGYSYVVVDRDLFKGDRRCDGKFMADFFSVMETAGSSSNELRKSQRVQHKRSHAETMCRETEGLECYTSGSNVSNTDGNAITTVQSQNNSMDQPVGRIFIEELDATSYIDPMNIHDDTEGAECLLSVDEEIIVQDEIDDFDIKDFGRGLRRPDAGIRCAGRKGTTRLVWLHEFFAVHEGTKHQRNCRIYQALQFLLGSQLPEGHLAHITDETRRDIWVLGVRHVPSQDVRQHSTSTRGYLFHSEFNDGDARSALLGSCPELVRVDNNLKWHNIHAISTDVPRVVHPDDIRTRKVHVVGRKQHYVCGVKAVEDTVNNTYTFSILPRTGFCMYPEERLGMEINSASMMWEHVEDIFKRIRVCMSSGRQGTSSASFSMPLLLTVFDFLKVNTFPQNIHMPLGHAPILQCQELIGKPDRLRRSRGIHKDRRCDATFAFQQILGDVYREVLDCTSRYDSFEIHYFISYAVT
jgi:hypothetical protein